MTSEPEPPTTAAIHRLDTATFRNFGSNIETIATHWYANPIQQIDLTLRGDFSSTHDGACEAEIFETGVICYVKPRKERSDPAGIGREKVVSDLGHLVGAPVAPSAIRPAQPGWPHPTLLSLECLPTGRLWSAGGEAHIRRLAPLLEALRVFWNWVADTDHDGHGQNLAWRIGTENVAVSAFDHSLSLSHNGADPAAIPACRGYGSMGLPEAQHAKLTMLTRILDLRWMDVVSIVDRLESVLTDAERKRILRTLEARRATLPEIVG